MFIEMESVINLFVVLVVDVLEVFNFWIIMVKELVKLMRVVRRLVDRD